MDNIATVEERKWLSANLLVTALVKNAPKDTWNLAITGIRIMQDDGEYTIIIGGEPAPYAKYTNENWDNFQPPLQGHKNPNEGWIDKSIQEALPFIKRIFEEDYQEDDTSEIKLKWNQNITEQYDEAIELRMKQIEEIKIKLKSIKAK